MTAVEQADRNERSYWERHARTLVRHGLSVEAQETLRGLIPIAFVHGRFAYAL
jgi:hypothetical protein